jgi:hypothetical protein
MQKLALEIKRIGVKNALALQIASYFKGCPECFTHGGLALALKKLICPRVEVCINAAFPLGV